MVKLKQLESVKGYLVTLGLAKVIVLEEVERGLTLKVCTDEVAFEPILFPKRVLEDKRFDLMVSIQEMVSGLQGLDGMDLVGVMSFIPSGSTTLVLMVIEKVHEHISRGGEFTLCYDFDA